MEKSLTAIVIKAEERKDNDYLIRLFSAEGIISAVLRGVRKSGAKMKFAAQPLAFCVYELNGNQIPVVTGASQIEDFSAVAADIVKFTACTAMLEAADYSASAVDCAESFVSLLKCIKAVMYEGVDARAAAIKYMQKLLFLSGFFRPERNKNQTAGMSEAKMLEIQIASSYLDDLSGLCADEDTLSAALCNTAAVFEKYFYCSVKSIRFFS